MKMNYQMKSFKEEVGPFLDLVTNDLSLESVWLSVMSMLEDVAAQFILSNITDKTPDSSLREILNHIKDEQRHAKVLMSLRPMDTYPEIKFYQIEEQFKKIGLEFIMTFFNSAQLREAQHRYAAYIHGAQTIERFPFRIYSLYLSKTKLQKVKKELPLVIQDEIEHINLGRKFYDQLSPEERMPLVELFKLEETVCLMMLKRMHRALKEHLGIFENIVNSESGLKAQRDKHYEVALNYAFYTVEKQYFPKRAEFLQVAITLPRLEFRLDKNYKKLEKELVDHVQHWVLGLSLVEIANKFNEHYSEMIYNTDTMALHYAYHCILEQWDFENENGLSLSGS